METRRFFINQTGRVDMGDFTLFAQDWMREAGCPCEKADLDCDGTVGFGDLSIISLDWLEE